MKILIPLYSDPFILVIEGNRILEIAVFVSFFKCIATENKSYRAWMKLRG